MRAASATAARRLRRRGSAVGWLPILCAIALLAPAAPARKRVDLLLEHGTVLPMTDGEPVIADGAVAVAGGRIVGVGGSAALRARFDAAVSYDARDHIVMPGLVNTHNHAAMTLLRGIADDRGLQDWLEHTIFPAEAKNVSPGFVRAGTRLACLEMIEGGTTTFADMYYFESDAARVVARAGLRGVLGETWIDFPAPDHKDLAETIVVTRKFIERWKGDRRIVPAVAPHAPYTCSKETLLAARRLALAERVPLMIHLAETQTEIDDARAKWKMSPVEYLDRIGFFGNGGDVGTVPILAAHGVWLDPHDREILKRDRVSLSHNPESNMKLASGVADPTSWQRDGIVWGLGTDGAASNNDLDMFEAMDFAAKLAKVSQRDPTALPARVVVAAATIGGARALGLADRIGSLEPGKEADLIAVDTDTAHIVPSDDPYSTLVYCAKMSDVTDVWVAGRRLLRNRRPTTLDESSILREARDWRAKIRKSLAMR